VVICVLTNLFEIIVLAADSQAFLSVRYSRILRRAQTEEDVLELIHSRVGKKQTLVADGNYGRAGDKFMAFAFEKVYKAASYLLCT